MKINVYKGTQEIGGTCIELIADNGKTLWLDIGQPLNDADPNIEYVSNHTPDAILISHPHRDHFGLLDKMSPTIPVYIGNCTLNLMNATNVFINQEAYKNNFKFFKSWEEFTILDTFEIFPHLTDHSSAESFAFTIECDGQRVFYSGDFRNGGAKKKVFENICKRPPKNIDVMFVEGTTIERNKAKYADEKDVENKLVELFKSQNNSSFIVGSGQNVDRIVAIFRACKRSNKTLIIDPYIAYILEIVSKNSKSLPQADWKELKVYNDTRQIKKLEDVGEDELITKIKGNDCKYEAYNNPTQYVYYVRHVKKILVDHIRKSNKSLMNLIYSQWTGYLQKENYISSSEEILELKEQDYIDFHEIHASGHASREDILRLVQSINAKKVIPIHTGDSKAVKKYLNDNNINTIELWEDNKEYTI